MSEQKKIQVYENDDIKVQFNPNVCEHAAECVKGHPDVFNVKARPWVQVDKGGVEKITSVIDKCPTGALSYEVKGAKAVVETKGNATEVTVVPNGPLRIAGEVVVKDMDGNVVMEASKMSLCRCGLSENKPFCDGTHKKAGWKS